MKSFRRKLTFSNVVACIALFVALGGAGYAATQLPRNSVRRPAEEALGDAAKARRGAAQNPAGHPGPGRAYGSGWAAGRDGSNGQNLTAETPLAPGATETGIFIAAGGGTGVTNEVIAGSATFVQPLPAPLDEEHVVRVKAGQIQRSALPGNGTEQTPVISVSMRPKKKTPNGSRHQRIRRAATAGQTATVPSSTSKLRRADLGRRTGPGR